MSGPTHGDTVRVIGHRRSDLELMMPLGTVCEVNELDFAVDPARGRTWSTGPRASAHIFEKVS